MNLLTDYLLSIFYMQMIRTVVTVRPFENVSDIFNSGGYL